MIAMGTPLALKTRQMQEQILDVRCDKLPGQGRRTFMHLPGIRDVSLFGAGFHVVTRDAILAEREQFAGDLKIWGSTGMKLKK